MEAEWKFGGDGRRTTGWGRLGGEEGRGVFTCPLLCNKLNLNLKLTKGRDCKVLKIWRNKQTKHTFFLLFFLQSFVHSALFFLLRFQLRFSVQKQCLQSPKQAQIDRIKCHWPTLTKFIQPLSAAGNKHAGGIRMCRHTHTTECRSLTPTLKYTVTRSLWYIHSNSHTKSSTK